MKELKVVAVGAGYFARFHVEAWTRVEGVKLVAICDHDLAKAEALAHEFGIDTCYQTTAQAYQEASFDIIDLITPPATHYELCEQAVANNKHIICQKPLAPTFEEAERLAQLISQSAMRFMVHENFRFQPWYRKIKELIAGGVIGHQLFSLNHRMRMGDGWPDDAYLNRQPYFRHMPRLLIHETGIHFIDVFRYLLGEVTTVYARLRKLNQHIEGEDCGIVLFDFENGAQAIFDGNRYNESNADNPRYTFGEMLIEGNQGSIRLLQDGSVFVQKLGREEEEIAYTHENKNFGGDCVYFTQKHFIDCLRNGDPFETSLPDYLNNLRVQEAIYQSAAAKKEISLV